MKTIRQILVIPFYLAGFVLLALSIVIDIAGSAVALAGAFVEGGQ